MLFRFGMFSTVLCLCALEGVTNKTIVGTMTRMVDYECSYLDVGNDTSINRLLNCQLNFPMVEKGSGSEAYHKSGDTQSRVRIMALSVNMDDIIPKFKTLLIPLIDEDKKQQAVLALLDLIDKDDSLDANGVNALKFEKYIKASKESLLKHDELTVNFEQFLTGLFLYTVVALENNAGKDFKHGIDDDFIDSFADKKHKIRFASDDEPRQNDESNNSGFNTREGFYEECGEDFRDKTFERATAQFVKNQVQIAEKIVNIERVETINM